MKIRLCRRHLQNKPYIEATHPTKPRTAAFYVKDIKNVNSTFVFFVLCGLLTCQKNWYNMAYGNLINYWSKK